MPHCVAIDVSGEHYHFDDHLRKYIYEKEDEVEKENIEIEM